jgi:hypothetical protein
MEPRRSASGQAEAAAAAQRSDPVRTIILLAIFGGAQHRFQQ